MKKEEAACWASNNGSIHRDEYFRLPKEILEEKDLEIVRVFLQDYYYAQDAGQVTIFESKRLLVLDIQNLWTKFGIRTDVIVPLLKDTGTRNILRPLTLTDEFKINSVLYKTIDLKWIINENNI